jgi:hypothetical protein
MGALREISRTKIEDRNCAVLPAMDLMLPSGWLGNLYGRSVWEVSLYVLESSLRYMSMLKPDGWSLTYLFLGIAPEGYHHVHCFYGEERRAAYDDFYSLALQVIAINVLSFAEHAQALLVNYIRYELNQPRAADWFQEWWTGARGRYTLAHAEYGGSNNNMGVEVDWRDMKRLVPASATLATFLGALVKNIRDLGVEHEDWLAAACRANIFRAVPCATKALYDLMQDAHPKTFSCCVVAKAQRATGTDVKWRKLNARIEAAGISHGCGRWRRIGWIPHGGYC